VVSAAFLIFCIGVAMAISRRTLLFFSWGNGENGAFVLSRVEFEQAFWADSDFESIKCC